MNFIINAKSSNRSNHSSPSSPNSKKIIQNSNKLLKEVKDMQSYQKLKSRLNNDLANI